LFQNGGAEKNFDQRVPLYKLSDNIVMGFSYL